MIFDLPCGTFKRSLFEAESAHHVTVLDRVADSSQQHVQIILEVTGSNHVFFALQVCNPLTEIFIKNFIFFAETLSSDLFHF